MQEVLFDHFYTVARQNGMKDIEAWHEAYEQTCNTMQELNRQELRAFVNNLTHNS